MNNYHSSPSKKSCVSCSSDIPDNANFCMQCGTQAPSDRLIRRTEEYADRTKHFKGIQKVDIESDQKCMFQRDCENLATANCQQKYLGVEMGCDIHICHEHQQLTFNSNNYRRLVVAALCLDCYPKMIKTKSRMNWSILILVFLTIFLALYLTLKNRGVGSNDETSI